MKVDKTVVHSQDTRLCRTMYWGRLYVPVFLKLKGLFFISIAPSQALAENNI